MSENTNVTDVVSDETAVTEEPQNVTEENTPEISNEEKAQTALAKFAKPIQDMISMTKIVLRGLIDEANALSDEIKASREDVDVLISEKLDDENTEDPTIQEYQERKADLERTLEENEEKAKAYVRDNLLDITPMSDEEYEAKRKTLTASVKQIREMKAVAEQFKEYDSDVYADLPSVKAQSARGGSAAGTAKPRIKSARVDGAEFLGKKNAKGRVVLSFGTLAEFLTSEAGAKGDAKVRPADLAEVALKESDNDLSVGADFNYSVNGRDFKIHVKS